MNGGRDSCCSRELTQLSLGMAVDREGAEKLRDGLQQKLIWATNKLMQDPDCEGKKESFI